MNIDIQLYIRRNDFHLDVNVAIPASGVTGLVGPSGCGKTSLLRAIAGLDRHRGVVSVADETWQDGNRFIPTHRRALGYVFQEASLFPHLSVRGNLEYGNKRVGASGRGVTLEAAIELLRLQHLLSRYPETLSGGERQRVAIGRALAVNPQLLLMDEPLAALDVASKQDILPYLESLHDELAIPVIYVSHSPDEVARLADHLVLIQRDGPIQSGRINELMTRLDVSLAHTDDAGAILEARVSGHDDEYALTYLEFAGGRFTVARKALAVGARVRLQIAARDVSLTLVQQSGTSILNIFPATIDQLAPQGESQMIARLLVAGLPILARVTRKSAAQLALKPGNSLYIQIKSVALVT